jgi:hypothetical protein
MSPALNDEVTLLSRSSVFQGVLLLVPALLSLPFFEEI